MATKNFQFKIDKRAYEVDILNVGEQTATVIVNGVQYEVEVGHKIKKEKTSALPRRDFIPPTDIVPSNVVKNSATLRSPLPGKVINIMVKVGDKVSIGDTVICIEAMKMENNIRTDREGTVKSISVQVNDVVTDGNVLLEIE